MAFNMLKPPNYLAKLESFQYQLDSFNAAKDKDYFAIFHEQGLGKTKIALDLALYWLKNDIVDTIMIATKKGLVNNWVEETNFHTHIKPAVLTQQKKKNSNLFNAPIVLYIMHYEIFNSSLKTLKLFLQTCRVGVILDECHKIKNPDSKIFKSLDSLSPLFAKKIIMSGTPVANRPYDVWAPIKFLDGGEALGNDFTRFKSEMDIPKEIDDGEIALYAKSLEKVYQNIKNFTIRETKTSSGIILPDKTIVTEFVDLSESQSKIYNRYLEEVKDEINANSDESIDNILERMLRLVQTASNPMLVDENYAETPAKYLRLLEILEKIMHKGEKVIVWTSFIKNADWLTKSLKSYGAVKVHGKLDMEARNLAIKKFKENPECKILVATTGAAKEGLTLTVANSAIFYDRNFSLDDYLQAQDRIHRISQERDCHIYNLIAKNTIDEWVDSLLNTKQQAAQLIQSDIDRKVFYKQFSSSIKTQLIDFLYMKNDEEKDNV